jgi:two-component sensor histidine kinase
MEKKVLQLDIKIPNQTRYLELVGRIGEDLAREFGEEGGGADDLAQQLNVVLTEAMANAIRHAHEDPDKTIHISISLSAEGSGFGYLTMGRFDLIPPVLTNRKNSRNMAGLHHQASHGHCRLSPDAEYNVLKCGRS